MLINSGSPPSFPDMRFYPKLQYYSTYQALHRHLWLSSPPHLRPLWSSSSFSLARFLHLPASAIFIFLPDVSTTIPLRGPLSPSLLGLFFRFGLLKHPITVLLLHSLSPSRFASIIIFASASSNILLGLHYHLARLPPSSSLRPRHCHHHRRWSSPPARSASFTTDQPRSTSSTADSGRLLPPPSPL
ncbi:hypothetical protein Dimus_028683, partial [Dionaea muscipula]